MSAWRRKRTCARVTFIEEAGGYVVLLDRRPVRTPGGAPLTVPTAALARAIAHEWDRQADLILPETMPLTLLAATAIDRIRRHRSAVIEALLRYAETDLLCYRAEHPAELMRRQDQYWQPLIEWAGESFGASLKVTAGVIPVSQSPDALEALKKAVEALDILRLTALATAVGISGSLIVGLAMIAGRLNAEGAFVAALLDERYQAERWGEDAEAADRRRHVRDELDSIELFLASIQSERAPLEGAAKEGRQ